MTTTYTQKQISPDEDYYRWLKQTAGWLRRAQNDKRYLDQIDLEALAEEIEDLAKRERRAAIGRMAVLLGHLLKWAEQPDHRSNSWRGSIGEARERLELLLEDNPSFKRQLPEFVGKAYPRAVARAMRDTGHDQSVFPKTNPFDLERQILNKGWLPE